MDALVGFVEEGAALEPSALDELLAGDLTFEFFDELGQLGGGLFDPTPAVSGCNENSIEGRPRGPEPQQAESLKRSSEDVAGGSSDSCDDTVKRQKKCGKPCPDLASPGHYAAGPKWNLKLPDFLAASRLEKNRQAAALSRSRKKDLISSLQQRVSLLEQANYSLNHALAVLQAVRRVGRFVWTCSSLPFGPVLHGRAALDIRCSRPRDHGSVAAPPLLITCAC